MSTLDLQIESSLHLKKQNFKFSSAHFLIFDEQNAEKLHGHNYQVQVEIGLPQEQEFKNKGYFLDFNEFKSFIKKQCDFLDEHVLLPKDNSEIQTTVQGASLRVQFRDRIYLFPKEEVILLPMVNTSVEQLSKYLCEIFFVKFKDSGLKFIRVYVEETQGQGASFCIYQ